MSNPFRASRSEKIPYAYDVFMDDDKMVTLTQEAVDDMFHYHPEIDFTNQVAQFVFENALLEYTETDIENLKEVLKPYANLN